MDKYKQTSGSISSLMRATIEYDTEKLESRASHQTLLVLFWSATKLTGST